MGDSRETVGNLRSSVRVAGHKAKVHPLSGKFQGDRSTDSTVRTGYQRNLPVQFQFHVPPPSVNQATMSVKRSDRKSGGLREQPD
jgi:hypothetical protein